MQKKWDLRYKDTDISLASPAKVLAENTHLLPNSGNALDLACGSGGNAIFLTRHGLNTDAFDNSAVIIRKLSTYAEQQKLTLSAQILNVETEQLPANYYDVIVVSYFLERSIFPNILSALKAGGLLYYQTWSQESASTNGPSSTRFRLERGELLKLCPDLELVLYREEGTIGNSQKGFRDEVFYIGKKSDSF